MMNRLRLEMNCCPITKEYDLYLVGFVGGMHLNGKTNDLVLARECIENDFDFDIIEHDLVTVIDLIEIDDGEKDRHYEIENIDFR